MVRWVEILLEGDLPHTAQDDVALDQQMQSLYNTPVGAPRKRHLHALGRIGSLDVGVTQWPPRFRTFFFFRVDDEPVGFAILQQGGRAGQGENSAITIIYLRPAYRKQGFGTAFYRFLMDKGVALEPDTKQSAGGAAVWRKLNGEHALQEIDRGGELGDDKQWDQVNKADVEPRQGELFPDDEKDYDVQGHFDGYDVATFNGTQDDDVTYALFRGSIPVAYISLKFFLDADNYYQVKGIRIAPSEQGKGLAPRFYHWLLTDGHIDRLYADEQQTDGGAKIWERLLSQPGIGVFLARMDYDAIRNGRRVKTLRGLEKVWQSTEYALYAEAI